ncbi:unnamed protein product, partial [Ectocarpus fasciculatus]
YHNNPGRTLGFSGEGAQLVLVLQKLSQQLRSDTRPSVGGETRFLVLVEGSQRRKKMRIPLFIVTVLHAIALRTTLACKEDNDCDDIDAKCGRCVGYVNKLWPIPDIEGTCDSYEDGVCCESPSGLTSIAGQPAECRSGKCVLSISATPDLGPCDKRCEEDADCTEPGEICCPEKKVCVPKSDPNACGDPHMTGFLGQKFDFTGEDGAWYCLVNDGPFHLNMRVTTPVPAVPQITYITGLSVITTDVQGVDHTIEITVTDPHNMDTSCLERFSPC